MWKIFRVLLLGSLLASAISIELKEKDGSKKIDNNKIDSSEGKTWGLKKIFGRRFHKIQIKKSITASFSNCQDDPPASITLSEPPSKLFHLRRRAVGAYDHVQKSHIFSRLRKPSSTKNEPSLEDDPKWYIDWDSLHCVQDCIGEPPCGGESWFWFTLYDSALECCQNHLPKYLDYCLSNSSPVNTLAPTYSPSNSPSGSPTILSSFSPSLSPSFSPTSVSSVVPSEVPSPHPSSAPSLNLSSTPSSAPTERPTPSSSVVPSILPSTSKVPSSSPTNVDAILTLEPSVAPSFTLQPTPMPSMCPTNSMMPTYDPTSELSFAPSLSSSPTQTPTQTLSFLPSQNPSSSFSAAPSALHSASPSHKPSSSPSISSSKEPSEAPSLDSTSVPSTDMSAFPSVSPTNEPTNAPNQYPSVFPSSVPSSSPSVSPSSFHSDVPSDKPSSSPSHTLSVMPSEIPSLDSTSSPSLDISAMPSTLPSKEPTMAPNLSPSNYPSWMPSSSDSSSPSLPPSLLHSAVPSHEPSFSPSYGSSVEPSSMSSINPSFSPSSNLSMMPSSSPSQEPTLVSNVAPTEKPSQADQVSFDLFAWGDPRYFGSDSDDAITSPLPLDEHVVDVSAGYRQSIILLPDGTARSSGYIYEWEIYYGQLGVADATHGLNPFRDISQVVDEDGNIVSAPPFKKVFAGWTHSLLIDADGNAWGTGYNYDGELCIGDTEDRMIPHKISIEGRIVDASLGVAHTLLLHESGKVFGCGWNWHGQIGIALARALNPTVIQGIGSVKSISAGRLYSLFLSSEGLHATGNNGIGNFCIDTGGNDVETPVTLFDIDQHEVDSFKASSDSTYILFKNGTVVSCGANSRGQLGDGTNEDNVRTTTLTPTPITSVEVGSTSHSTFFVGGHGVVYATGRNGKGNLGVGDAGDRNLPTTMQVSGFMVDHISAGQLHTLAMFRPSKRPSSSPSRSSAPSISLAQSPSFYPSATPSAAPSLAGTPPTESPSLMHSVSPSSESSLSPSHTISAEPSNMQSVSPTFVPSSVVSLMPSTSPSEEPTLAPHPTPTNKPSQPSDPSFQFYAWGDPKSFGENLIDMNYVIPDSQDEHAVDVSAGNEYSIILRSDGKARAAGYIRENFGYDGWLGVTDVDAGTNPFRDIVQVHDTELEVTIDAPLFEKVFAGYKHSLLIDLEGNAWTAGWNSFGQLCLGDEENRMIFHKVSVEGRIVDAAVGYYHTLLLHENGTVFGCGYNINGEIGTADVWYYVTHPTKLSNLFSVESVSTGRTHSLFLTSDGLYVTGDNSLGQTCFVDGNGSIRSPIALTDINREEVDSFQASQWASYILFKNGTVVACGDDEFGQLGDGTNSKTKLRTKTLAPTPVKKVGVGPMTDSAFLVDNEGVVYAMGKNWGGNLGIGDTIGRNLPIAVKFGENIIVDTVSAGHTHTLAIIKQESL